MERLATVKTPCPCAKFDALNKPDMQGIRTDVKTTHIVLAMPLKTQHSHSATDSRYRQRP